MNRVLTILFFEDYFVCTLLPNSNNWKKLKIDRQEKIPLYFYVSENKVRNDDFAKERYIKGDSKAYGDFYNIILDESYTYIKYDSNVLCIRLLSDILTKIKSEYQNQLSSYSASSPYEPCVVNLLFSPCISTDSSSKIVEFFKGEGFKINSTVNYYESFLFEMCAKGTISNNSKVVFVETYDGDLYFTYIEFRGKIIVKRTEQLKGKGVDHRIEKLAWLIVKRAAKAANSPIAYDSNRMADEAKRFFDVARNAKFVYEQLDLRVELSDFSKTRIIIDETELKRETAEANEYLRFKFETFVSKNANISIIDKIILNGEIFSNNIYVEFFERYGKQKVLKPFPNLDEILSKGVFGFTSALDPQTENSTSDNLSNNLSSLPPPPLPKLKNSADIKINNVKPPLPPPIPKPKNVVPPNTQNSKNGINENVKKTPPPPLPVPKLNSGTTEKKKVIIPPPPPLPKSKVDKVTSKKDIK
ncbi:MAG: hypothetical protein ACOYN6_02485 [Ignavibacteria bacterium]